MLNLTFAMEALIGSGQPLPDALADDAATLSNSAVRDAIGRAGGAVVRGQQLSDALDEEPALPARLARWVAVGERTGEVEASFAQLAVYYRGELDQLSERFLRPLEPAVILLVGLVVVAVAFLFVIPIFSIYESL